MTEAIEELLETCQGEPAPAALSPRTPRSLDGSWR